MFFCQNEIENRMEKFYANPIKYFICAAALDPGNAGKY